MRPEYFAGCLLFLLICASPSRAEHGNARSESAQSFLPVTDYAHIGSRDRANELNNFAVAEMQKGQFDLAASDLTKAIALHPTLPYLFSNLGDCKMCLGNARAGLADFTKAVELSPPGEPVYYYDRAHCEVQLHDFGKALADLNEALSRDPHNASIFLARAFVEKATGNLAGEKADYEKAMRLDPKLTTVPHRVASHF